MASSDTEDEDTKAAIAMSLSEAQQTTLDPREITIPMKGKPSSEHVRPATGIAGLDRQAMEKERLARLASKKRERERSISPPLARNPRKAPKLETTGVDLPSGARLNMFSTLVQHDQESRKSAGANAANNNLKAETNIVPAKHQPPKVSAAPGQGELQYPHGVVKKTWAFGHERTGAEIKLEEVLEPLTLRTAVLSAFQWDMDWILSKLKHPANDGSTKCIFVMQAKDDALKRQMLQQSEGMRSFLRLCFPPMPGAVHCMHSKLMLLFHSNKLRIAIPSANLLNFDWGETGLMENSVFVIDLPRLADGAKAQVEDMTCFGKELLYFLEKQTLDEDVRDGVLSFDFAATAGMAFVHTAGGDFYGDEAGRTGLLGLGRAVRSLNMQTGDLEVDFAASSIGSLKDEYLQAIHDAARGQNMIVNASAAASKAKANFFSKTAKAPPKKSIRDMIRIYFPTKDTVQSSTAGAAGTICLSRQWYENMPFPRSVFRDYVSTRPGLLSHNKILYARGKQKRQGTASTDVAWAYVGSANMSESAWGKLVFDKKAKAWKIACRNWECGVLLPMPQDKLHSQDTDTVLNVEAEAKVKKEKADGEDSETESEDPETESEDEGKTAAPKTALEQQEQLVGMEVFDGFVSLPFEYPGRAYNGREPWYFKEQPRRAKTGNLEETGSPE